MSKSVAKQTTQLSLPGEATAVSLILPENLSFERWEEVGHEIARCERAVMWWMGDWWNYGERKYGEMAAQATDSDYSYDTWRQAARVARAIEPCRRLHNVSWSIHQEVAPLPPAEQDALLAKAAKEEWSQRDTRRAVRRLKAGTRDNVPFPTGKYRIIYADPPWEYGNEQPEYHTEQANHYPVVPLQEICDLPVKTLALDNAVLFLWVTSPILAEAREVITAWGFEYKASFIWDKVKHNMGHYNSVRHELLLVCVRGSCPPDEQKLFDSVQSIERTRHSAKPEKFREIIDTIYPSGPRIELFNRGSVPEPWKRWGNE